MKKPHVSQEHYLIDAFDNEVFFLKKACCSPILDSNFSGALSALEIYQHLGEMSTLFHKAGNRQKLFDFFNGWNKTSYNAQK